MEPTKTTFKHPGDLDSEIWEWLKEHGTEETKQIIMMTARHFAGFKEQPDPRHSLIEFIKWSCDRGSITPEQRKNVDFWLAYLEKKKEQKPESCDCSRDEESYTNGIHHVLMNPEAYGLIKQKPAEQLGGTFTSYDMAKTFTEGQNYVIAHPEKFGLCRPAEWSEEDDRILKAIIDGLGCIQKAGCKRFGGEEMNDVFLWIKNRFKSLHPQSVQDKFDEAMHVADKFEEGYKAGVYDTKAKSWKPSNEQMEALKASYSVLKAHDTWGEDEHLPLLLSLCNDLQKLP